MEAHLETTPATSAEEAEETVVPGGKEAGVARKRVLLLEDDPDLREALKGFLTESGYTVTLAADGVDAAHRVIDADFEVVVCDMVMPLLSGESSFRAISKLSPQLHDRFIFITGHHHDPEILNFVSGIKGKMLAKPFEMQALLNTIELLDPKNEKRQAIKAARVAAARALIPSLQPASANRTRKRQAPAPTKPRVEIPASAGKPLVVATAPVVAPTPKPPKPSAFAEEPKEEGFSFRKHLTLLVTVSLLLGTAYHLWTMKLRERIAGEEMALAAAEAEWTTISSQLQEAEKRRPEIERLLALPGNFDRNLQISGWTPLLKTLVTSAGADTVFQQIQARGVAGDPAGCELTISGFSTGQKPRAVADRFRQALLESLKSIHPGSVTVRFEELEDAPEFASETSRPKANFTVLALMGVEQASSTR